ncbi:MAG: DNA polymerase III subunit gamma/tau [Clostridia bacterium]|nr:DNA polymerase III subunit gamma/tau [Clostridia bacterium]
MKLVAYVAMYREWRPKTFADIIGQNHISRTLQNAMESDRIAHAYLFCGPRGTGKTSTAKVLAKALNCLDRKGIEPCNECENCRRINQGSSMDVLEIDAASNRGIDEIRDLREKVKFAPSEGKYKVYIIDEVHMLTNEAFNALLKTLEEPPGYVVFVLATTEPHKIPLTIMSRCQRFDFRRISLQDIIDRLRFIGEQGALEISGEALFLIAKTAEGGMRDALSILDQCVAFGGNQVDAAAVHAVVGTVSSTLIGRVMAAAAEGDVTAALQAVDTLSKEGKDLRQFLRDLIDYCRDLILVRVCRNPAEIVRTSVNDLARLQEQSSQFSQEEIMGIIGIFTDTEQGMRWTTQPRLVLELGIIKAVQFKGNQDLSAIVKRVEDLENKVVRIQSNPVQGGEPPKAAAVPRASAARARRQQVELGAGDEALLARIQQNWPEVLELVKKQRRAAQALLVEGQPYHINGNCLTLLFKDEYSFHRDKVEQPDNKQAVEQAVSRIVQQLVQLRCVIASELKGAQSPVQEKQEGDRASLIREAKVLFGEELIEIKD